MNHPTPDAPFVGRGPLLRRLEQAHRTGRCIMLFGPGGAGKTRVIKELTSRLPVLYAPAAGYLGRFVEGLEPQVELEAGELKLAARVHRLAAHLPRAGRLLVIDHVTRVPPRLAHLIRALLATMPVWFVTRSVSPLEIGHVWPYLFMFKRIDVRPFTLAETRALLTAVPFAGDRRELLTATLRLHRLAAGHPATLVALLAELRARTYDLRTMEGLHVLALHARITDVAARLTTS